MTRRLLPWIGLFFLAISFLCFVLLAPPVRPVAQPHRHSHGKKEALVVVLDPGHGGTDSGAMCGTVLEKDLTLDVALRTELLLRSAGFRTVLTRDSDSYRSLSERAALANEEENSLFVSIHFNDGKRAAASGVETYFAAQQGATSTGIFAWLPFLQPTESKPLEVKSEKLAGFLQAALVEQTGALNRGTKSEQFYVIANVQHPAALVEGGFLTNPDDATKLATAEYREEIAAAISDGLQRYRETFSPNEPTLAWAGPSE